MKLVTTKRKKLVKIRVEQKERMRIIICGMITELEKHIHYEDNEWKEREVKCVISDCENRAREKSYCTGCLKKRLSTYIGVKAVETLVKYFRQNKKVYA